MNGNLFKFKIDLREMCGLKLLEISEGNRQGGVQ